MKALKTLLGLGLAALISCTQTSDESILAKKSKEEFLRNENEIYQKSKFDQRAKPIAYKIEEIVKSDNPSELGELNVVSAAEKCQLNATVEYYNPLFPTLKGYLEIAWVELIAECPESYPTKIYTNVRYPDNMRCYFNEILYARVEYGFVKDKNNEWCHFTNSFEHNGDYFSATEDMVKSFKKF